MVAERRREGGLSGDSQALTSLESRFWRLTGWIEPWRLCVASAALLVVSELYKGLI